MTSKKQPTLEEALAKLETIERTLENGDLPLEEALAAYEEAIGLIRVAEGKLAEAKDRVRLLVEAEDGTVKEEPFPSDEN